jgi:ABC-type polysaccharide/polyol phosphate export permease
MSVMTRDDRSALEEPMPRPASRAWAAWHDLYAGLAQSWMWAMLAMQDIKLRYRGSILGPFWLTLSTLVMVASMGLIYARVFNMSASAYLPNLALGMIIWQFVSALFSDGCQTFTGAENIIQQVPIAFSVHVYRVVFRNLVIFGHSALIIPIGWLMFKIPVGWSLLQIIPGIILILINGVWIGFLFGMLSARFRDVPPIVASFLQVLFFATPIIWPIEALRDLQIVADINPIYAAIDVIRAPLLGVAVSAYSWPMLIGMTIVGWAVTFPIFARFRSRIAYWI